MTVGDSLSDLISSPTSSEKRKQEERRGEIERVGEELQKEQSHMQLSEGAGDRWRG